MAKDRRDPYRNFKFRLLVGGVVLGAVAAAAGIARRLFAKAERRYPGVHLEETPTGTRPIDGVGTSTAGFAGRARSQAGPKRSGTRPRKAR